MGISNITSLIGGVALFLFGMDLMGKALKKLAGSKLEIILYKLSGTPLRGILLGTGVTAVIQSSSATSVMVVGFVNSGMMKVKQAIGIIMGAIIGTSITGWIICLSSIGGNGLAQLFSTDTLTAGLAAAGIILLMFTGREKNHHIAEVFLGFAVLMFGIGAMTDAVYPLRESDTFIKLLTSFSNPLLGVLIGLLFTCVIQSASAAVGILQALAVTGAVDFGLALPVIMGIAIGASVPVLLSAIGANASGKRTALIYLAVDTLGAIIVGIVFYSLNAFMHFDFMDLTMSMASIALLNTVFRIVVVLLLSPFIGLLDKLVCRIVKEKDAGKEADLKDAERLEERFLDHPALAIEQTRICMNTMASLTRDCLKASLELFGNYSEEGFSKAANLENTIDIYEDKTSSYIVRIMAKELSDEQDKTAGLFLHSVNDFERISDHAKNLAEAAKEMYNNKVSFTEDAEKEMRNLFSAVLENMEQTVNAFSKAEPDAVFKVAPLEEIIDDLCRRYKLSHIERIQTGKCSFDRGFIFNDMLTDLERIGDHCSNIGIALRISSGELSASHGMISRMEIENEHDYQSLYAEYVKKYNI